MTFRSSELALAPVTPRCFVVGVPRSGSTWAATVLARTKDAVLVSEPDNQLLSGFALREKRRLGRGFHPYLSPGERDAGFERLWFEAFGMVCPTESHFAAVRRALARGALSATSERSIRRAFVGEGSRIHLGVRLAEMASVPERPSRQDGPVIVKSVYAELCVEWVADLVSPQVVVVLRDVRNVVSSWLKMGWLGSWKDNELVASDLRGLEEIQGRYQLPTAPTSQIGRLAWFLALLTLALEDAAYRHPDWLVVRHEALCQSPSEAFATLAQRAGLVWTEAGSASVAELNRPGNGFEIRRVAAEMPEIWRSRLDPGAQFEIERVLESFPTLFDEFGNRQHRECDAEIGG